LTKLQRGDPSLDQRPQRAVRVDQIETVQQDCGDAANGGLEPTLTNAAKCGNVCF